MGRSILEEILLNGCFVNGNTIVEVKEGKDSKGRFKKRLSFNPKKDEKVIFFEFENCDTLLKSFDIKSDDKKIDFVAIYLNNKRRILFLIEMKRKRTREALQQVKFVINFFKRNENFRSSFNKLKSIIKILIIHTEATDKENTKLDGLEVVYLRNPVDDRQLRKKLKL